MSTENFKDKSFKVNQLIFYRSHHKNDGDQKYLYQNMLGWCLKEFALNNLFP